MMNHIHQNSNIITLLFLMNIKKAATLIAASFIIVLVLNYAVHQRSPNLPPSDDQLPATSSPCEIFLETA